MSHLEARLHLQLAYLAVMGNSPNAKTLSRLLAQWALETGRGAGMWGYNFGGLKAAKGGLPLETRESYGLAQRPSTQRFRSYRTAVEGARDYVQTLARHFPKAFSALHHGSTTEFVQALAEESYFTGNPDQYRRAMVLLAVEYE